MATRKGSTGALPRREQLMSEHLRAALLSERFPKVGQLRIEMAFSDPEARVAQPSPQLRTLYPAAPAFFRFMCPCADCDGIFDLTETITDLLAKGAWKSTRSLGGNLKCQGTRFREHAVLQTACSMALSFRLAAEARASA